MRMLMMKIGIKMIMLLLIGVIKNLVIAEIFRYGQLKDGKTLKRL